MFFQKIGRFFGRVVKEVGSGFFGNGGEVRGSAQGINIVIPPQLYNQYGPASSGPVRVTPRIDAGPIIIIGAVFGGLILLTKLVK